LKLSPRLKASLAEGTLRISYDRSLLDELNCEQYELTKTGGVAFTHQEDIHNDRLWALALAAYAAEKTKAGSPPMVSA
jgi:hypothetical protein